MAVDSLSTTFAALADPTRRAILAKLVSGECSVTELAEPFEMSMPAVSKHLRVLERAGLARLLLVDMERWGSNPGASVTNAIGSAPGVRAVATPHGTNKLASSAKNMVSFSHEAHSIKAR